MEREEQEQQERIAERIRTCMAKLVDIHQDMLAENVRIARAVLAARPSALAAMLALVAETDEEILRVIGQEPGYAAGVFRFARLGLAMACVAIHEQDRAWPAGEGGN